MDLTELENALRERCPSLAEPAMAALQPCLRIHAERADDVPVGASKFGGDPDLPSDLEWPRWDKGPLDFLAQIRLGDVDPTFGLPASGTLLFFADFEHSAGLFDTDRDGFRVLWTEADLERRPAPEGATRHTSARVTFRPHLSLAPPDGFDVGDVEVPDEESEVFDEVRRQFGLAEVHQLLGQADFIQRPVEEETVQAIAGVRRYSSFDRERWEQVKPQAEDWRLLLQIASDRDLDYMWGDVGSLYFTIRRDALQCPGPQNTWYVFQCS